MEEESATPPALSPAGSSGSSPEALSSIDFELSEQISADTTTDMDIFEPLHAFIIAEDRRRSSSSSPPNVRVKGLEADYMDFTLIESDQDDMCFCDDDLAFDRRLLSLGCPDNTSAS